MPRRPNPDSPQRQSPDHRPYLHQVRYNEGQERAAQRRAKGLGLTVSKMLADLGTEGATTTSRKATNIALMSLAEQVRANGQNGNQIARVLHSTGAAHADAVDQWCSRMLALEADIRAQLQQL